MIKSKLGKLLLEQNLITQKQLNEALSLQESTKKRVGELLIDLQFVSEEAIARAVVSQTSFAIVRLDNTSVSSEALDLVSREIALKYSCIPLKIEDKKLTVAMSDPLKYSDVQDLQNITGHYIDPVFATKQNIAHSIERFYKLSDSDIALQMRDDDEDLREQLTEDETEDLDLEEEEMEAPIIKMEKLILTEAIRSHSSDIHIEPQIDFVQVRNRIDGSLKNVMRVPKWMQNALISRFKIMGKMDLAEKRVPQDGKRKFKVGEVEIDMRVSTLPTKNGEKIVIRILEKNKKMLCLEGLGLYHKSLAQIKSLIYNPQGIILVVGPTGSGKTTTLYSILNMLKAETVNIITIEDPIEYELEGINQVQVHEKAGLTFAKTLRSVLRQDPDIILLGEIRDSETAEIAFRAAMTGHLVLSTLHTPDTTGSLNRIFDLGITPAVASEALLGIVAQRLVRLNCEYCKEVYEPSEEIINRVKIGDGNGNEYYKGKGCEHCHDTGYSGRMGIYEVMSVDSKIREVISRQQDSYVIRRMAIGNGMMSLANYAMQQTVNGKITVEEFCKIAYDSRTEQLTLCSHCKKYLEPDFKVCPYCEHVSSHTCKSCSRDINTDWVVCPYCGQKNTSFMEGPKDGLGELKETTEKSLIKLDKKKKKT